MSGQASTQSASSWGNSIPRELAVALRDREDEESIRAAQWLAGHEWDGDVWTLIGCLLDDVTRMAQSEDQR